MTRYSFIRGAALAFFLSCAAAVGAKPLANPVGLGTVLLGYDDIEKVTETCRHYEFVESGRDGDFFVFEDNSGNIIRVRMQDDNTSTESDSDGGVTERSSAAAGNVVQIIVSDKKIKVDKTIAEIGFRKVGDRYVQGSTTARKYSVCDVKKGKHTTFTFSKVDNTK